jgi:hypothetical protein
MGQVAQAGSKIDRDAQDRCKIGGACPLGINSSDYVIRTGMHAKGSATVAEDLMTLSLQLLSSFDNGSEQRQSPQDRMLLHV